MAQEITLKIILESPPAGVDIGLQKGSGSNYETIQKQRTTGADIEFVFDVSVKLTKEGMPNFLGPHVHGTPKERFIYLDIGTCAGQMDSIWTRRLKIPLRGITPEIIDQLTTTAGILEAKVPGTGKDKGPNCATVKPFNGWKLSR